MVIGYGIKSLLLAFDQKRFANANTIQYNLLINSPTGVFQNQFTYNNGKK